MEAIKNLRESSVLLSNLSFDSYRDVANLIYGYDNVADVCDIISCPSEYVDTLVGMVRYNAELRNKIIYNALVAYATEDDYRAIYAELLAMKEVEGAARELYATMSNNDDRSEEEKEDDILFEAEMDKVFSTPEEDDDERQPYDFFAFLIYDFDYALTYVSRKPSDDLDIEYVKQAVLNMVFATGGRDGVEGLHRNYNDRDYRETYRELHVKLNNDIADIDEDIYLHDGVPYSIEMCDDHRVVCPHFEQIIEADEVKEAAFFDDDVDFILDEETGKVELYRDHTPRLTEEDYEEMERLEADDNFHASLYEADHLPF